MVLVNKICKQSSRCRDCLSSKFEVTITCANECIQIHLLTRNNEIVYIMIQLFTLKQFELNCHKNINNICSRKIT